jgi:hypothetical protein
VSIHHQELFLFVSVLSYYHEGAILIEEKKNGHGVKSSLM